MLIECLIEREGFTVVNVQRSRYEFKRNDKGDQVCDIISSSHSDHLLKLDDFRLYNETEALKQEPTKQAPIEKIYACDRCGKEFTHPLALSGHKRSKECRP